MARGVWAGMRSDIKNSTEGQICVREESVCRYDSGVVFSARLAFYFGLKMSTGSLLSHRRFVTLLWSLICN